MTAFHPSFSFSFSLSLLRALSAPPCLHRIPFPPVCCSTRRSNQSQIGRRRAERGESEKEPDREKERWRKKMAILMNSIWPSTPCPTRPPLPSSARPLELWSRLQFVNVTNDLYPFLFPSFSPSFFSPAPVCPHSGLGPSNHFQSADSHLKSAAVIK